MLTKPDDIKRFQAMTAEHYALADTFAKMGKQLPDVYAVLCLEASLVVGDAEVVKHYHAATARSVLMTQFANVPMPVDAVQVINVKHDANLKYSLIADERPLTDEQDEV